MIKLQVFNKHLQGHFGCLQLLDLDEEWDGQVKLFRKIDNPNLHHRENDKGTLGRDVLGEK